MYFGTSFGHLVQDPAKAHQQIEEAVTLARTMSSLCYTHLMTGHHILAYPIYSPLQPMPVLARMAPETGDMKLVTSIIQMPLCNPVDIAEQGSTIDHISNGRFVLGLGNGYRLEELESAGTNRSERVPRVEESIDIITRLWAGEDLDYKGQFWRVRGKMGLTPQQKPRPPIWIAVHAAGAARRGARLADGVMMAPQLYRSDLQALCDAYEDECAKVGRRGTLGISRRLVIVNTEREKTQALEALKRSAEHSIRMYGSWDMQEKEMANINLTDRNDPMEFSIVGSVEDCIEGINRYKEETKMDLFQFTLVTAEQDLAARQEALQFASEEVLSKVQ